MKKPKIKITLVGKLGPHGCHRGHKVGDSWDFDTERGTLCPMALHAAFPFIDILRYGGKFPEGNGLCTRVCCPDAEVANVFQIEKIEEE